MTETAKTHSELCVIAERIKAAMASCVESFCMEVADSIENEIGRGLTEQERQQISETASGLLVAQDQLEAERQRADKAESYARERDSENESIALTVGRLRLELAELRGEQEPVAWEWQDGKQRHVTNDEGKVRDLAWDGVKLTPLSACQPKPVVVLHKVKHWREAPCNGADWAKG